MQFRAYFSVLAAGILASTALGDAASDLRKAVEEQAAKLLQGKSELKRGVDLALSALGRQMDRDTARMRGLNTTPEKQGWDQTIRAAIAEIAKQPNVYGGEAQAAIAIEAMVYAGTAASAKRPADWRAEQITQTITTLENTGLSGVREATRSLYFAGFEANPSERFNVAGLVSRASGSGIQPPPLTPAEIMGMAADGGKKIAEKNKSDPALETSRLLESVQGPLQSTNRWGRSYPPELATPEARWTGIVSHLTQGVPSAESIAFASQLVGGRNFPAALKGAAERAVYATFLRQPDLAKDLTKSEPWSKVKKSVEATRGAKTAAMRAAGLTIPPPDQIDKLRDLMAALVLEHSASDADIPTRRALADITREFAMGDTKMGDYLAKALLRTVTEGQDLNAMETVLRELLPFAMQLPTPPAEVRKLLDAMEDQAAKGRETPGMLKMRGDLYRWAFRTAPDGQAFSSILMILMGGKAPTSPFTRAELGRILADGLRRKDFGKSQSVADAFNFVLRMAEDARGSRFGTLAKRFPGDPPLDRAALTQSLINEMEAHPDQELFDIVKKVLKDGTDAQFGGKAMRTLLASAAAKPAPKNPCPPFQDL